MSGTKYTFKNPFHEYLVSIPAFYDRNILPTAQREQTWNLSRGTSGRHFMSCDLKTW